jgi:D-beta-D-heptose 7-phosphate kinase/D-beta-D-heptose 1-phosphate adenosyltransferase
MCKIKTLKEIKKISEKLKKENKIIVFTNGCFDIIHPGHIKLLKKAKSFGDVLIVGLNKDSSIKKLKGKTRPIINEKDRAEVLSSLSMVDYVVLFGEKTPIKLIKNILPNYIVKGGDYKEDEVVGKEIVEKYGGKVIIVPLYKNYSTTNLIKKVNEKNLQDN